MAKVNRRFLKTVLYREVLIHWHRKFENETILLSLKRKFCKCSHGGLKLLSWPNLTFSQKSLWLHINYILMSAKVVRIPFPIRKWPFAIWLANYFSWNGNFWASGELQRANTEVPYLLHYSAPCFRSSKRNCRSWCQCCSAWSDVDRSWTRRRQHQCYLPCHYRGKKDSFTNKEAMVCSAKIYTWYFDDKFHCFLNGPTIIGPTA